MSHLMKRRLLAGVAGIATALLAGTAFAAEDTDADAPITAHDFAFESIDGGPLPLSQYAGRPVLVVNTASRCGFTYQYDGLQALYDTYRDQGLVVLGVPSDDFGGQELATEAEVKQFCEVNFAIDFPMTEITRVRGEGQHPFYAWAEDVLGPRNAPGWNFHKYLVGPDGTLLEAFGTSTKPEDASVLRAVEAQLVN
ncbi:MAG: glutathione peroxidase [Pseudomonadota bacterium]